MTEPESAPGDDNLGLDSSPPPPAAAGEGGSTIVVGGELIGEDLSLDEGQVWLDSSSSCADDVTVGLASADDVVAGLASTDDVTSGLDVTAGLGSSVLEVEETSQAIYDVESAGRGHLGLDSTSPPAPSVNTGFASAGSSFLEGEEVWQFFFDVESVGRDQLGLDSTSPHTDDAGSLNLEVSELICDVKSAGRDWLRLGLDAESIGEVHAEEMAESISVVCAGGDQLGKNWAIPTPAETGILRLLREPEEFAETIDVNTESIGEENRFLSLEDVEAAEPVTAVESVVGHDQFGLALLLPRLSITDAECIGDEEAEGMKESVAVDLESIGKAMRPLSLKEEMTQPIAAVESIGQDRSRLDLLFPPLAVTDAQFVGEEMEIISLGEEVGKMVEPIAFDAELTREERTLSMEELEETLRPVIVEESAVRHEVCLDSSAVETICEVIRNFSLEEGELEEMTDLNENDEIGLDSRLSHSDIADAESVEEGIGSVCSKEELEETVQPISSVESEEEDQLRHDFSSPSSTIVTVGSIGEDMARLSLEVELEEKSAPFLFDESEELDHKTGLDLPPLAPASFKSICKENTNSSLEEGEVEEISELIQSNDNARQDQIGLYWSPSVPSAFESICRETTNPSFEEGEIEEMLSMNLGKDQFESNCEEIRKSSFGKGEMEEMSELIPFQENSRHEQFEPNCEEINNLSLEEGGIEEISEIILSDNNARHDQFESNCEGIRTSRLEDKIHEMSELVLSDENARHDHFESNHGEIRTASLEEGEIEEDMSELIPSCEIARQDQFESNCEEITNSSFEEGEIEYMSETITSNDSVRQDQLGLELFPHAPIAIESNCEEIRCLTLEEGEQEEVSEVIPLDGSVGQDKLKSSPPVPDALESIQEELRYESLEEGEIEEMPDLIPFDESASQDQIGLDLSPSAPETLESVCKEITNPDLEEGELVEISEVVPVDRHVMQDQLWPDSFPAAQETLESIPEKIRNQSLVEGELLEIYDPIPVDENAGQTQLMLDSASTAPVVFESIGRGDINVSLKGGEMVEMSEIIHSDESTGRLQLRLDSSSNASAVFDTFCEEIRNPALEEVNLEEGSKPILGDGNARPNQLEQGSFAPTPAAFGSIREEIRNSSLEQMSEVIPAKEIAGWDHFGLDSSSSALAAFESICQQISNPNLEDGELVEMPVLIPVETGLNYYEASAVKFEGVGTHIQEIAGWGEDNPNIKEFPPFRERGGWLESPQTPLENTAWDENAANWGVDDEFEGGGDHGKIGYEHSASVVDGGTGHVSTTLCEQTGWGNNSNVDENSGWTTGAAEWPEGGGVNGGSEHEFASLEYPLRPGEPNCFNYLKIGTCKYGPRCKYNHPPEGKMDQARYLPDLKQNRSLRGVLRLPTPASGSHAYAANDHLLPPGLDRLSLPDQITDVKDVSFKLLCPNHKIGGVIGSGGMVVKALENETGAAIWVGLTVEDSEERVITISAPESQHLICSQSQDAVIRVFRRSVEVGTEKGVELGSWKGALVTARLLVPINKLGCLTGKDGEIIAAMRTLSGTSIRVIVGDQIPKCASKDEVVVQIDGELASVQDALIHVTRRLRDSFFPHKLVYGTGIGAYTSPGHEETSEVTLAQGYPISESCKFGNTSRYAYHGQYQKETGIGELELNSFGFPLRPGEKECSHYMRTGTCDYLANCRFHHPDPAATEKEFSDYGNGASSKQLVSASQLLEMPQSSKTSNIPISSNASQWTMLFPPQKTISSPDWKANQLPVNPSPSNFGGHSSKKEKAVQWRVRTEDHTAGKDQRHLPSASSSPSKADGSIPQQAQMEYAERSDPRPNCPYFMTFGTCKSGSSCRYQHSRTAATNAAAADSSSGQGSSADESE